MLLMKIEVIFDLAPSSFFLSCEYVTPFRKILLSPCSESIIFKGSDVTGLTDLDNKVSQLGRQMTASYPSG